MKKNHHPSLALLFVLVALTAVSCASNREWTLDWQDQFNGNTIDENVWSRIPRGKPDWQNTQSSDDRCYELRNGTLVLKGIVNDNLEADPAPYLTGGIWTRDKKSFAPGKFEVRARLQAATGAWPAIWLMPYEHEKYAWPTGGEIDIMERLNHDSIAYQTVHTHYTHTLKLNSNPKHSGTSPIRVGKWNVYGVEMYPDSIVFTINGKTTHVYPRIETDQPGQFPFYIPQEIRIDQQLGGSWVGEVDPKQLPVEMEVDWVKHYVKRTQNRR